MTFTNVTIANETGNITKDGATYQRTLNVAFTGSYSVAQLMRNSDGRLPKRGEVHPEDGTAFAKTITPGLADNSAFVDGVATYQISYAPPDISGSTSDDPRDKPPVITWGGSDQTEVSTKTAEDTPRPMVNSAGELYTDLQERPVRGGECSITIVMTSNPATICDLCSNTTNQADWYGVSAGNGLFGKITGNKQYAEYLGEQISWWEATFPIRFNKDGWRIKPIDNGYAVKVDDLKIVKTDDSGCPTPTPTLLDGSGNELAEGADPVIYPPEGYINLYETDWGTIPLPDPFED